MYKSVTFWGTKVFLKNSFTSPSYHEKNFNTLLKYKKISLQAEEGHTLS